MDISVIKQGLSLSKVLTHYGLAPDRNNRLCCPFHLDKTPSLQVYLETNTCYCFSSNCQTHGKSIDVIDFIMYKENLSKHEAILKAQSMLTAYNPITTSQGITQIQLSDKEKILFLEQMFTYFKNAVYNSKPAQEYIQQRGLDYQHTEIGYNSGQFHHGERRDELLITNALKYGLLLDRGKLGRTRNPAYGVFGKGCICFPLKDQDNRIVSLYFRSISNNDKSKHFYLKDRQGLYPSYPSKETTKLILCESIIDCASLLEQKEIRNNYSVLALYGTNGLSEEHQQAISELSYLEEIILFLDGDEAGEQAVIRYAEYFNATYPNVRVSQVDTPQGEDINSLLLGHDGEVLVHLLDNRQTIPHPKQTLIFSSETKDNPIEIKTISSKEATANVLDTTCPYNLRYKKDHILYQIKGFRCEQADSLKVTLQISVP